MLTPCRCCRARARCSHILEFGIDGRTLAEHLLPRRDEPLDYIAPFGWPGEAGLALAAAAAARLLRKAPPDLPSGRYSLLVCPKCADLGGGALSAVIERQQDVILWHSFGFETDYVPEQISPYERAHEFAFRADLYCALLRPYLR